MPTSVRLDPETDQRLGALAAQTGRSKAFYLREIIARGLEDLEDYCLAADVLERVRKGEETTHPLDEAVRPAPAGIAPANKAAFYKWLAARRSAAKGPPMTSVELLDLIYDERRA